jgi:hypothetical protein
VCWSNAYTSLAVFELSLASPAGKSRGESAAERLLLFRKREP